MVLHLFACPLSTSTQKTKSLPPAQRAVKILFFYGVFSAVGAENTIISFYLENISTNQVL
jgi:hypothetical protein